MDHGVKAFPDAHFPEELPSASDKRELFSGWGGVVSLDVVAGEDRDSVAFAAKYGRVSDKWRSMCACTASLPLLKHNPYPGYVAEPCMAERTKKLFGMHKVHSVLKKSKGHLKRLNKIGEDMRRSLKILQWNQKKDPSAPAVPNTPQRTNNGGADRDADSSGSEWYPCSDGSNHSSETEREPDLSKQPIPSLIALSDMCHFRFERWLPNMPGFFEDDVETLQVNTQYSGGSLTTIPITQETGCLVAVRGDKLCDLYLAPYNIADHRLTLQDDKSVVRGHDTQIYQCEGKLVQGQMLLGVREQNSCQFLHVDKESLETKVLHRCDWKGDDLPMSLAVSPYITGEAMVCTRNGPNGYVHMLDHQQGSTPEVVVGPVEPRFPCVGGWCHGYWGAHPRELIFADHTGIAVWDIRSAATTRDLLCVPHKSLHTRERILATTPYPTQPFYHCVATDYSVLLLDSRFPNNLVLRWPHSLLSLPQYIEVVPGAVDVSDHLVLLASQAVAEVHAFPVTMDTTRLHPPLSASYPWRVSRMTDFGHLASRVEPVCTDNFLTSRLDVALAGISGIPHGPGNPGFSVLQMSSTGNLFCQDYRMDVSGRSKEKTYSPGPCSSHIRLAENDYQAAHNWLTSLFNDKSLNHPLQKLQKLDITDTISGATSAQLDAHILCRLCSSIFSAHIDAVGSDEHSDAQHCFRCGQCIGYTNRVKEAVRKGDHVTPVDPEPVPLPAALQTVELDANKYDITTQIIFKLWENEDVTELSNQRDQQHETELMERFDKWKEKKLAAETSGEVEAGHHGNSPERDSNQDQSDKDSNHGDLSSKEDSVHGDKDGRDLLDIIDAESTDVGGAAEGQPVASISGIQCHTAKDQLKTQTTGTDQSADSGSEFKSPNRSGMFLSPTRHRAGGDAVSQTPSRVRNPSTSSQDSAMSNMGFASTPQRLKNQSSRRPDTLSSRATIERLNKSSSALLTSTGKPQNKKLKRYDMGF